MVGDSFHERWKQKPDYELWTTTIDFPQVSKKEFDDLKKEVEIMKDLLVRAKIYDEQTGQKDCEMDEKVAFLKKIAEFVGVSLEEVFGIAPKE